MIEIGQQRAKASCYLRHIGGITIPAGSSGRVCLLPGILMIMPRTPRRVPGGGSAPAAAPAARPARAEEMRMDVQRRHTHLDTKILCEKAVVEAKINLG